MVSRIRHIAAALLFGGFAILCTTAGANADDNKKPDDKVPDLHDIMGKNKGKNSLSNKINEAAKGAKWDDCQKLAKELKELGIALGKNTPDKGSEESWKKHSKSYAENTAAVADAAAKKDAKAVSAATATFGKSCAGCHKEHK